MTIREILDRLTKLERHLTNGLKATQKLKIQIKAAVTTDEENPCKPNAIPSRKSTRKAKAA